MGYNTKLFLFIANIQKKTNKKIIFFEIYFAKGIFFLFFGFLVGNLFGSFLNIFRESINWNGFITILILLFEEFISYLTYSSKKRVTSFACNFINIRILNKVYSALKNTVFLRMFLNCVFFIKTLFLRVFTIFFANMVYIYTIFPQNTKETIKQFFFLYKHAFFIKSLNLFKIGLLLGFFIDAFKVGS